MSNTAVIDNLRKNIQMVGQAGIKQKMDAQQRQKDLADKIKAAIITSVAEGKSNLKPGTDINSLMDGTDQNAGSILGAIQPKTDYGELKNALEVNKLTGENAMQKRYQFASGAVQPGAEDIAPNAAQILGIRNGRPMPDDILQKEATHVFQRNNQEFLNADEAQKKAGKQGIDINLGGMAGFNGTAPLPTGEEYLKTLNQGDRNMVSKLIAYELDPLTIPGFGKNSLRNKYLTMAIQADQTYDPMQVKPRSAYLKDFSAGKRAAGILSANTLLKHAGNLDNSLENVPSSGSEDLEKLQRGFTQRFMGKSKGALAMTDESTALNAVAGELANVFKQTGGTDTEIESWLKAYNKNASREAKKQYLKTGAELLHGRLGAWESEYERTIGKPYNKKLIDPKSEEVYNRLMGLETSKFSGQARVAQPSQGATPHQEDAPAGATGWDPDKGEWVY